MIFYLWWDDLVWVLRVSANVDAKYGVALFPFLLPSHVRNHLAYCGGTVMMATPMMVLPCRENLLEVWEICQGKEDEIETCCIYSYI